MIYTTWNEHLRLFAKRAGTTLPVELKRKQNTRIIAGSLLAAVCAFVEEQGAELTDTWGQVLKRVKTTKFLQKGYGVLKNPNLCWLFSYSPRGRGVDRVLEGKYDGWSAQAQFSPDEGI
jgi:hypothetical protein